MRSTLRSCLALPLLGLLLLQAAGAVHAQADRGLFYKVEKDGKSSYLLGTVHAWKREWLPLNPAIEKAFAESKTLAVEFDPAKMDTVVATQRMMLEGGETLESRLGSPLYERTKKVTDNYGMPDAAISRLKPWGVMMVLTVLSMQQLGYSPDAGIDQYLLAKARAGGKTLVDLESADRQLAVLDSLSPRLQTAMLSDFLANTDRMSQYVGALTNAWKEGNGEALVAISDQGFPDAELKREFNDKFLYQRDIAMTRRIEELLRQPGPHFIAVGSLHLVGPRSIVEQLRAKGYRVEQI